MRPQTIDYLAGYPPELRDQAETLRSRGVLEARVLEKHPAAHEVRSNAALRTYAMDLKNAYMRSSPPLAKVRYHDKLSVLHQALGLHTYAVRVQGARLKSSHDIRIASLFKDLPEDFLRMVVVHELAHLRHKDHDKAFYRLCCHMEPDYPSLELELRLLLFARAKH
jgi:predicted metal-dependent hydrolase